MKNKGFAISGILYTILLIFLALMMMLLFNFEGKKNVLDKIKSDVLNELNANKVYANGYAVYFNPVTGKVCTEEEASTNVNEFGTPTNIKTGCMKWYTFNDTKESDTVKMILDHNAISNIKWNNSGSNVAYEDSNIPAAIQIELSNWDSNLGTTIITADEVNAITGKTGFDVNNSASWYYFDSKTQEQSASTINKSAYAWLYDNTYGCINYGCNIEDNNIHSVAGVIIDGHQYSWGYWTGTTVGDIEMGTDIWRITRAGNIDNCGADSPNYGIRPVITVSKDVLNPNIDTCSIEPSTQFEFDYTGGEQEFEVPCDGYYKLETWGASGGNSSYSYTGGYGGYSYGNINLSINQKLYLYIGGKGLETTVVDAGLLAGGYNGGGSSNVVDSVGRASDYKLGSGGGATHIALLAGILSSLENDKDSIIIVSGGGGGAFYYYNSSKYYGMGTGGSGGGYIGVSTSNTNYWNVGTQNVIGGTQFAATGLTSNQIAGRFGYGSNSSVGGGGGYYGGNTQSYAAGSGGSGYIGNPLLTDKSMYCYNCTESNEESTKTVSTTCHSNDPTENCAKEGNGYAKITYLGK